jgi:hypothetical protein
VNPLAIAVDSVGTQYVADGSGHTIRKISTSGKYESSVVIECEYGLIISVRFGHTAGWHEWSVRCCGRRIICDIQRPESGRSGYYSEHLRC